MGGGRVRYPSAGRAEPAAGGRFGPPVRTRFLGHVSDNSQVPVYRDEAVVLRTHKLGEADRIITLLCRQQGKVRAVAKGVRRTSSKFGSRLEPFSHVDIQLAAGRNLDIVTQVVSTDAFGEHLISDYGRWTAGQVIVETADRLVAEEREPALQQFLLVVGALRALDTGTADGPRPAGLILDSYLLRAMAVAGYAPSFFDCARCGLVGPHTSFSPAAGGVVCERCRPAGSARPGATTLALLSALLEGRWEQTRDADLHTMREASGIAAAYTTWHLDRNLKSLAHVER